MEEGETKTKTKTANRSHTVAYFREKLVSNRVNTSSWMGISAMHTEIFMARKKNSNSKTKNLTEKSIAME